MTLHMSKDEATKATWHKIDFIVHIHVLKPSLNWENYFIYGQVLDVKS